ncbi:MAG: HU family DNA-binding protein [Nitrospiria bacterium]
MTKGELIEQLSKSASKNGVSKKDIESILSDTFQTIGKAIKKSGRFSYPGFGTFTVTKRAARKGRNPQTGEPIKIKASKSIKFKPAPVLKGKL